LLLVVPSEDLDGSSFVVWSGTDERVRAEGGAGIVAQHGDSGELRFRDQVGGVRCEGESAEMQERAG
jgi:hypothetical protein